MNAFTLCGDCLEELKTFADNKFDSIVTDPPYGLSFMGKKWDYQVPSVEIWKECLRVLKPGGHLLSFSSARTYHRMVVNVEDAGFEIRDQLMWVYGSGFPKSHNVGKKVPEFEGWGTGLKPAHEPIVLARKPISEKTIASNVLKWGTGAINIDKSRVGEQGRFPANFIHDGSQKVLDLFPTTKSGKMGPHNNRTTDGSPNGIYGKFDVNHPLSETYGDEGSASRFFYCAKASKKERNEGMPEPVGVFLQRPRREDGSVIYKETHLDEWKEAMDKLPRKESTPLAAAEEKLQGSNGCLSNTHPTIKPQALMSYLINLITPPNGVVLDPFMGSGSTGVSCLNNGFSFVGIDREQDYVEITRQRLAYVNEKN